MKSYWTVPQDWHAATVAVIGGGPSVTQQQVDLLRDRVRVIAINDAYRLAPWADVLYFCDCKWWRWHNKKLTDWRGLIVRLQGGDHDFGDSRIKVLRNLDQRYGLAERRDGLHTGQNSGYQAINLAVHFGAARILLIGFDMQAAVVDGRPKTHWFGDHPGGTSDRVYAQMLKHFPSLLEPLKKRGVDVINCTPHSALKCFPMRKLEDVMASLATAAV